MEVLSGPEIHVAKQPEESQGDWNIKQGTKVYIFLPAQK